MDRICIIAEAGVNHNGSISLAKKMIDTAVTAGADYIKFQTFVPKNMVAASAKKADYQLKVDQRTKMNGKLQMDTQEESQLDMLNRLSLTFDDFIELKDYAVKQGIGFLSTPFDLESIEFLKTLNLDFWKLPSGEMTNLPYLEALAETGKPIVMSTGMCSLEEVEEAYQLLNQKGTKKITILQCNTEYPTPFGDVNLRAMKTMADYFHCPVGYSDHTQGLTMSIAAAALGATIIEKHFTLDRTMEGPDHRASLEPNELEDLVFSIRQVELGLGSELKKPSPSELKNRIAARKSIVAAKEINKNTLFTVENLTTKRPGSGLSPMNWYNLLGKVASRDYQADELIDEDIDFAK